MPPKRKRKASTSAPAPRRAPAAAAVVPAEGLSEAEKSLKKRLIRNAAQDLVNAKAANNGRAPHEFVKKAVEDFNTLLPQLGISRDSINAEE